MDCKVLAVLSCIGIVACSHPEAYTNRQQLYNDLMHKYEKNVLPNSGNGNGVNVTLDIMIRRIIGMNNHILTLDAFIPIHWRADNLKWKPDKVGGIKMIDMPSELVWKPDSLMLKDHASRISTENRPKNNWIRSFLTRHPVLSERLGENIDISRASMSTQVVIDQFYTFAICQYPGCHIALGKKEPNRQQLYDVLMHDYQKNVMPNSGDSNGVNVTIGVTLRRIMGMNNHILTLDSRLPMRWWADNLKWKPDQVGGIKMIDLPSELVWKPDLSLVEGAGESVFIKDEDANVIISSDGQVIWDPPVQTKTFCKYGELHNGDEIDCNVTFLSWTHSAASLELKLDAAPIDISFLDALHNPHWKLVSTHAKVTDKTYRRWHEAYAWASFTLRLR